MTESNDELKQPDRNELTEARIDPHIVDILLGPVEQYVKALQVTNDPEKIRSACSRLVRLGFINGVITATRDPESLSGVFEAHQQDSDSQDDSSE